MSADPPTHDPDPSDAALMARAAAGDRAAFEVLATRHLLALHRAARRVVGDAAEAEDLAQEAMLRAWQLAARFDPSRGSLRAWLHRIVTNLAIDRLRRARPAAEITPELADTTPDPETALRQRRRRAALLAAVLRLPARQRRALALTYAEGWPSAAIGLSLGISTRAVEGLLRRARLALREGLRAH